MEFCGSDPSTPKDPYRNFQAGSIVSFMKGVLDPEGNCDYFDNLEVSGILGISTLNEHSPNGWRRCAPLQCINDSAPYLMAILTPPPLFFCLYTFEVCLPKCL